MGALPTLFFICVIDVLGFGIMVPLLPYMADRFGATPALITMPTENGTEGGHRTTR